MPGTSPPPMKRFTPTPVETTVKKVRRFAAEPVETTARSNRQELPKTDDASQAVEKRDFAASKRRFLPEPVETTFMSSKQPNPETTPPSAPRNEPSAGSSKPRKKFVPELIETSKRSKRTGDSEPATLHTDKTDLTPGIPNIYTRKQIKPHVSLASPSDAPDGRSAHIHPLPPRRQPSMRPHYNTRRSTRQDSFHPDLDAIPSEESSDDSAENHAEGTPSLSDSVGSSNDSNMRLQMARTRESCDDRFSGYLLSLAAKAAEKQLREQALAAFPNESLHEIVEHFYDREIEAPSDEESVSGIGLLVDDHKMTLPVRRKSTEVGWAQQEMQAHQEKLNRVREEETNKKVAAEASKPTFQDPFWTNGMTSKSGQPIKSKDAQKEAELERMRSAASPPMLGDDLNFRMCPSPKATKFESDQNPDVIPNRSDNGGGLWGGYCVAEEAGEYLSPTSRGPELIQTPNIEREDPFSSAFSSEVPAGTKSPRFSSANNGDGGIRMLAGLDERLQNEIARSKAEQAVLIEFNDTFVSQVYNYLSLGYPALARPYDAELARISRIPEEALRVDDKKLDAKGHIGIVIEGNSPRSKGEAPRCGRWKALKVYIHEWARQNPSLSGTATPTAWGVRARRGSWAI